MAIEAIQKSQEEALFLWEGVTYYLKPESKSFEIVEHLDNTEMENFFF